MVEFFSTAKIPLSVCGGGGIFKAWWNFSTTQIPLLILEYLSVWRNYFWWYFSILKLLFQIVMFEGLDFDLPDSIGGFKDVDDLLLTLNSLVHVSEHLWSGITNEAPHQRLVDQFKAMQQSSAENKAKRPRMETIDVVTGAVDCSI